MTRRKRNEKPAASIGQQHRRNGATTAAEARWQGGPITRPLDAIETADVLAQVDHADIDTGPPADPDKVRLYDETKRLLEFSMRAHQANDDQTSQLLMCTALWRELVKRVGPNHPTIRKLLNETQTYCTLLTMLPPPIVAEATPQPQPANQIVTPPSGLYIARR